MKTIIYLFQLVTLINVLYSLKLSQLNDFLLLNGQRIDNSIKRKQNETNKGLLNWRNSTNNSYSYSENANYIVSTIYI